MSFSWCKLLLYESDLLSLASSSPTRMVNNSQTESSPTSTGEASVSASSSTGSSHLADTGLDLSSDRRDEAEQPQASQSQIGEEDEVTLDTKKDQQLG